MSMELKPKCHILIDVDNGIQQLEIDGTSVFVLATLLSTAEKLIIDETQKGNLSANTAAMIGLDFAARIGRKTGGAHVQ